jgi:aspartokinase-like uncharacterized kinase
MSAVTTRVIKVGGSLLDWPELPQRLWKWLQSQTPGDNYFLAGGGELVDVLRRADRDFQLGDAAAHALAIDAMGLSGKLVGQLLKHMEAKHGQYNQRRIEVLDVQLLLSSPEIAERAGGALPPSWNVTSDSIAAHLACAFGATELVLLKSADLPRSLALADAAAQNFVDQHFPLAAARVRKTRFINLRREGCADWMLYP